MREYVWLFPLLFIFHDMEEIIGFGVWLDKNRKMLDEKYPFISRTYKDFSTEGFALAVFEELMACIMLCLLALFTDHLYIWLLWLGGFIACTIHFVIHIVQSVVIRQYIPALLTSIIAFPVSIGIIWKSIIKMDCKNWETLVFGMLGIVIVALNLKFAQSLIGKYTRWMERKDYHG